MLGDFLGKWDYIVSKYASLGIAEDRIERDEAIFISTTESADKLTNAHIDNNVLGFWTSDELTTLGASQLWDPNNPVNLSKNPYTDRLRPVTDIAQYEQKRYAMVVGAEFYAYDVKISGGTGQTAAVNTEITTSLSTQNNVVPQTVMLDTIPVDWLINFFRPKIYVAKNNLLRTFETTNPFESGDAINLGDYSIGPPLPYKREIYRMFENGLNNLRVYAYCANRVYQTASPNGIYIRRFPLKCRLVITHAGG